MYYIKLKLCNREAILALFYFHTKFGFHAQNNGKILIEKKEEDKLSLCTVLLLGTYIGNLNVIKIRKNTLAKSKRKSNMISCFSRYFVISKCDILIMFGLDQTMDDGKIIKNAPHIIQAIKMLFQCLPRLFILCSSQKFINYHHKLHIMFGISFITCLI